MSDVPSEKPTGGGPTRPDVQGAHSRPKRIDKMIGAVLAGKYEILKKIGEGGMGSVYIANQKPFDRRVAVKVLLSKLAEDEIAVKRFEQEARAISRMQHPNTVTVYDFGRVEDDGGDRGERLYIVMEYLKGSTLTQVLRKEGALPGPRASRIMRQVCASLADAHGAGIIHRDLKPDNIFLCELGGEKDWVKVLDFGVAKLADSEVAGTLTQTGMIFGTPKYMSPEQAEGKPIDYRADIYALGVVLYELLTGKPPFVADTPVGLLLKHITEPPPPFREAAQARDIDPHLEAIVMRALEKHPDRRQQQVTELALDLEQYERAVTGPQVIPTDGARLPGTTGARLGLPTEVVPGTVPGQPITPSDLAPPDRVPSDLDSPWASTEGAPSPPSRGLSGPTAGVSDGLPSADAVGPASARHPTPGAGSPGFVSTGRATAPGAPVTAPALTAPVGAGGHDTFGGGLSGPYLRPRTQPKRARFVMGTLAGLLLVGTAGLGFLRMQGRPVAVPLSGERPLATGRDSASGQRPGTGPAPGEGARLGADPAGEPAAESKAPAVSAAAPASAEPQHPRTPFSKPEKPAREASPVEPSRPALPEKVSIRLASAPPGATVSLGGRQVGVTPVEIEVPRGDERLTFVFQKRGFESLEQATTPAQDAEIEVRLRRRTRPRPPRLCPDGSRPPCAKAQVDPLDLKVDDLK